MDLIRALRLTKQAKSEKDIEPITTPTPKSAPSWPVYYKPVRDPKTRQLPEKNVGGKITDSVSLPPEHRHRRTNYSKTELLKGRCASKLLKKEAMYRKLWAYYTLQRSNRCQT